MDKYSREYWEKLIKEMRYSGVRPIIYSKKYLTEKAKMEFLE